MSDSKDKNLKGTTQTTYLEACDGSCKFYQVEVQGSKTIATFGKIGGKGRKNEKEHANAAKATEYAADLVSKQKGKGYETTSKRKRDETEEVKEKITTEEEEEADAEETTTKKARGASKKGAAKKKTKKEAAPKKAKQPFHTLPVVAPVVQAEAGPTELKDLTVPLEWRVAVHQAYGIYVDETHVYTGDENGLVQQFDKSGNLLEQYEVRCGVKCIVGDGIFLYVGTMMGYSLFDITSGTPRLMCKIQEFAAVCWMDIRNGLIAASDNSGKVALINTEGETTWVHQEADAGVGWTCLIDDTGVYHGNRLGVQKRELTNGEKIWSTDGVDSVLFGQQDEKYLYVACGNKSYKLNKEDGKVVTTFPVGGSSIGVSKDGKTIATGPFTLFNSAGEQLHDFNAYPASMATYGEHEFYGIRNTIEKYNFSPDAIAKLKAGEWKGKAFKSRVIPRTAPETSVVTTTDTSGGILCKCVKEDGKMRIRVTSPGYNVSLNVQFPRTIREEGAEYVVEQIIDQGSFYRAWGVIKRVQK